MSNSVDEISPEVIESTARQIEAIQQHQQQQQQHLAAHAQGVPHHPHTPQIAQPPPHALSQDQVMHPPPHANPQHSDHSQAPTSSGRKQLLETRPRRHLRLPRPRYHPAAPQDTNGSASAPPFQPPPMYTTLQSNMTQQPYYDYNGQYTGASTSTFRPNKRPRNLTEEEAAAITRNFSRGDFFVGNSAPVRIDPRLPVRLTLARATTCTLL
ncbi:hypothetical protein BD626DRAFT_566497 [Schizophyllum amplum]|uniref:Uncharacterized protein n=1 Tax=Schizophyllum amplum TaxID=97359 RepID=A0A550CM51_9AGAR|nr:hypothetical protein BD626DRAFT_566497 [Auriculariopsis ampla]